MRSTKAKISELKARLSAYLAEVRRGGEVLVYNRETPIARLVPIKDAHDDLQITSESSPPTALRRIRGVRPLKAIDLDNFLGELRQDR